MRPIDWKEFRDVCLRLGWMHDRTRSDHYIMTKPDAIRPVTIPMKRDLKEDIILSNLRTMGINRRVFKGLLNSPKGDRTHEIPIPPDS